MLMVTRPLRRCGLLSLRGEVLDHLRDHFRPLPQVHRSLRPRITPLPRIRLSLLLLLLPGWTGFGSRTGTPFSLPSWPAVVSHGTRPAQQKGASLPLTGMERLLFPTLRATSQLLFSLADFLLSLPTFHRSPQSIHSTESPVQLVHHLLRKSRFL